MGLGVVPELRDERVSVQDLLHDSPLDPAAPAVDQAYLPEAGLGRHRDVFVDDRGDLARMERMQVERILERDAVRHACWYVAVTVVAMPPRAVKVPTTVMRRGEQAETRSSRIWLVAAS